MAVMFNLRVALTLLGLLCLTDAHLDASSMADLKRTVKILQKEKQDIATKYTSTHSFKTRILDKGIILVDKMSAIVEEYGIQEEFPLLAEFVEDLKEFLEETKDYTNEQINTMADDYQDKEEKIKSLLLKLLQSTDI